MKNINQKGFTIVEIVLIFIVVCLVVGLGYYVYNANNTKTNTTSPQTAETAPTDTTTAQTAYLTIKEWGVKIPLTDLTKNATYRVENGYAYLDVAVEGDTANTCKEQATVTKVSNPDENSDDWRKKPSELDKEASKVNGVYYLITGNDAMCSENSTVQEAATKIRSDWVKQANLIVAE